MCLSLLVYSYKNLILYLQKYEINYEKVQEQINGHLQ